jgi:hypothetical protein
MGKYNTFPAPWAKPGQPGVGHKRSCYIAGSQFSGTDVRKMAQQLIPDIPWLPVTLLIRADEFCIGQDMALHCALDLRKVTVPADRRTRSAIARLFEIIEPD